MCECFLCCMFLIRQIGFRGTLKLNCYYKTKADNKQLKPSQKRQVTRLIISMKPSQKQRPTKKPVYQTIKKLVQEKSNKTKTIDNDQQKTGKK